MSSLGEKRGVTKAPRAFRPGAEQPIVQLSEPSANLPAHVHLYQRELFEILRIDVVEVGG